MNDVRGWGVHFLPVPHSLAGYLALLAFATQCCVAWRHVYVPVLERRADASCIDSTRTDPSS